jgi:hypothetical protein
MSRDQRRYLLVIAVLILSVGAAGLVMFRDRLTVGATSNGYQFVADVDNWQRTEHERAISTRFDFNLKSDLKRIPLKLGDWQGEDVPQSNVEVFILLEPEQYVQRMYRLPDGRFVWLSLIGSRKSKSFHSPQICYDTDGWKTEASSEAVPLDRGEVYALRLVAQKAVDGGTADHIITYFYLWPSYERNPQDGMVLVKLTAPLYGTVDETVELEKRFFRELFTSATS